MTTQQAMATLDSEADQPADNIERLRRRLSGARLDAFLTTSGAGLSYLTGVHINAHERFVGVLVPAEGEPAHVVPSLEAERMRAGDAERDLRVWQDGADPLASLAEAIRDRGLDRGTIGIEEDHITFGRTEALRRHLPDLTLSPASAVIIGLRLRKSADEIRNLQTAADILSAAVQRMFDEVRVGMTELEVQARLTYELAVAGSEEQLVIALAGPNSAYPHGTSGPRPLQTGDLLTIDATAMHNGYVADITRCTSLGPPSDEAREWWDTLVEAQAAAIALARHGTRIGDLDRAARDVIARRGYGDFFVHRTGHGLGLEVHEAPYLFGDNDQVLEEGMVITVEPGIYVPGTGGLRLEDDVVVTAGEPLILTSGSRELRVLQ